MPVRVLLVLALFTALAQDNTEENKLDLRPRGDWKANKASVQKVIDAAAAEIWVHFPDRKLPPIIIDPKGGPITYFKRGANGEIYVDLNTGGTLWAQITFQWAHEFCHVLCSYDADPHKNKWFEESVCEVASLYVLRKSAETWKTKPPYNNWKSYAKHLRSYADNRMAEANPGKGKSFLQWFRENKAHLDKNATDRPKNNVVAKELLPLFEAEPDHWEAVTWLNAEKMNKATTFKQYLHAWQKHAPDRHKEFIRKVASKFNVRLPRGPKVRKPRKKK